MCLKASALSFRSLKRPSQLILPALPFSRSQPADTSATRSVSGKRKMPVVTHDVTLTEHESAIFATLSDASKSSNLDVTLRCAGGWVRDKLLGKDSDDIDIALDKMLGREFANKVNAYLEAQNEETHSIGVIQCNPEQSKHLETARMKIRGTWIDLVNLRSETYTEGSRVPTMEFGSPQEDAMRRDFTINSLFYNINERTVEDFTGRGVADLEAGVMRTPLPPRETFLDDPLRVLRAVRFAARFGFQLEETLQRAAASSEVRVALQNKVSRERVGTELEGMFKCADPVGAVRYLVGLGLFPIVFQLPQYTATLGSEYGENCLAGMDSAWNILQSRKQKVALSAEERRVFLLAALLLPLRLAHNSQKKKRKKEDTATFHVIREGLKWRAKDSDTVELLHAQMPMALELVARMRSTPSAEGAASIDPDQNLRVGLGLWVRKLKELWKIGALLCPLMLSRAATPLGVDSVDSHNVPQSLQHLVEGTSAGSWDARFSVYDDLAAGIEERGLQEAWKIKPMLDGKSVMSLLGMTRGGPKLGEAMEDITKWQLAHPDGDVEALKNFVKDTHI